MRVLHSPSPAGTNLITDAFRLSAGQIDRQTDPDRFYRFLGQPARQPEYVNNLSDTLTSRALVRGCGESGQMFFLVDLAARVVFVEKPIFNPC